MFDVKEYHKKIIEAKNFIKTKLINVPEIVITAGSGLSHITEILDKKGRIEIPFSEIPHHPKTTVEGHKGNLIFGKCCNKYTAILSGRVHIYEGNPPENTVFLIRALIKLGVKIFIFTNAAGGLNTNFKAGSFMILTDHVNFMFKNPLIGQHENDFGDRFPDMSSPYDKGLREIALRTALENKIEVFRGVYVACSGPMYESKKEVEMIKMMGDAVGMSTVPEVLAARQANKKVLAISIITNLVPKPPEQKLTHSEVLETAKMVEKNITIWLKSIVKEI